MEKSHICQILKKENQNSIKVAQIFNSTGQSGQEDQTTSRENIKPRE
jgi:hypothetical protein